MISSEMCSKCVQIAFRSWTHPFCIFPHAQSDTAGLLVPELELELESGTLGGKYTTLEGLLNDIKTQLSSANAFLLGDSEYLPVQYASTHSIVLQVARTRRNLKWQLGCRNSMMCVAKSIAAC